MSDGERLPLAICWHCGEGLDDATELLDRPDSPALRPVPGAISLCLYCAAIAVFDDELQLQPPTETLLDELGEDPTFRAKWVAFLWARQRVILAHRLLGPGRS